MIRVIQYERTHRRQRNNVKTIPDVELRAENYIDYWIYVMTKAEWRHANSVMQRVKELT